MSRRYRVNIVCLRHLGVSYVALMTHSSVLYGHMCDYDMHLPLQNTILRKHSATPKPIVWHVVRDHDSHVFFVWADVVSVCCSVLQCVAVCCSVLQCVLRCLTRVFCMGRCRGDRFGAPFNQKAAIAPAQPQIWDNVDLGHCRFGTPLPS